MKKLQLFILSLLSGGLLYAAWPVSPFGYIIFIALIPLLLIADKTNKRIAFFGYTFLSLLIFNAGTTWWIWNSTDVGSIAAIVANSLLMCLPWWGFHIMLKNYGKQIGYASLVCFWMLFEFAHLNWQLSWPWLTLGNAFASLPRWVEWYSFTGVAGGTLWILLVNIGIKRLISNWVTHKEKTVVTAVSLVVILLSPLLVSHFILAHKENNPIEKNAPNVVMVQANINPYLKFEMATATDEIQKLITLSETALDSNTQLILWPETALSLPAAQEHLSSNENYQPVFQFLQKHPTITLLTGIETYKFYGANKATETARKNNSGAYYDAFNSALSLKVNEPIQIYNKSKLVPGVESMPTFLNFLAPVFDKFGGTTGGYGRNDSSMVFRVHNNPYKAAPIICYESIYGEYVSSYVKRGANLIAIITNDGWWGNTPGHKQHLAYAQLRAIETRRWVARSANTGISAVIDDYGEIISTQPWDKAATIKYAIPTKKELSFYVAHGDYIYRITSLIAIFLLLWHCFQPAKTLFKFKKFDHIGT